MCAEVTQLKHGDDTCTVNLDVLILLYIDQLLDNQAAHSLAFRGSRD